MKLAFFDFDDTLFYTPLEQGGKEEWEKKMGRPFPQVPTGYRNFSDFWWKSPQSLDIDVFNIKTNDWIIDEYKKCKDMGYYLIMMTGRVESLRNDVIEILDSKGLKFDELHFKPENGETFSYKIKTMEDRISELKPNEVIFYDDRKDHHQRFIDWAKSRKDVNITIVNATTHDKINNSSRVFTFNEFMSWKDKK